MGTAMNMICNVCKDDKNKEEEGTSNYFINETDTSAPQSIMDIKINQKKLRCSKKKKYL
jgi:hypothetical protein